MDEKGEVIRNQQGIKKVAVEYFEGLFKVSKDKSNPKTVFEEVEFSKLSSTQVHELNGSYSREEVIEALKQMHPSKAPGPDGFHAAFFNNF